MANFKLGDKVRYEGDEYEVFSVIDNGHTIIMKDPKSGEEIRAQSFQVVPNAKFKVGDYVEVIGPGLVSTGRVGKVIDVDKNAIGWPYTVYFPKHSSCEQYSDKQIAMAKSCRNSVVANALAWKNEKACNADMVEVMRKQSGVKTIVSIDDIRKGTEYGKDLTGYERNMLGRGIDKLSTDEFVYSLVKNSTPSDGEVVENSDVGLLNTILKALEQAKSSVGRAYGNYTSKATDKTAVEKISAALDNVARSINDASQAIRASV